MNYINQYTDFILSGKKSPGEFYLENNTGTALNTNPSFSNTSHEHGLLQCRMDYIDYGKHILMSSLDETIYCGDFMYELATHHYPGTMHPDGARYICNSKNDIIPETTYCIGSIELKKEIVLCRESSDILIRYSLNEASAPIKLRFNPLLAFRNIRKLRRAYQDCNPQFETLNNGIKFKLEDKYPYLYMQFSKDVAFRKQYKWYYNFEYREDKQIGRDYLEDLFSPGFFEVELEEGEEVIFTAGLSQTMKTETLHQVFIEEYDSIIEPEENYNLKYQKISQIID